MALAPRQAGDGLGGQLVGLHRLLGDDPCAARAVRAMLDGQPVVAQQDASRSRGPAVVLEHGGLGDARLAVVPDDLHGLALALGGELPGDLCAFGVAGLVLDRVVVDRLGLDAGGQAQVKCPERRVQDVADPVADRPRTEMRPPAPVPRMVERLVVVVLYRSEPQVPVDVRGHVEVLFQFGQFSDLAVDVAEGVAGQVRFGHVADCAVGDPFPDQAHVLGGVALVAYLCDYLVLDGGLAKGADLGHRVRQGLLAIHVLAALDRIHAGHRMRVVRRADDYRVDLLVELVEHLAEVGELLGLGELLESPSGAIGVDVAQADDVRALIA